jgi:glucose/arabinose dehydrogenase
MLHKRVAVAFASVVLWALLVAPACAQTELQLDRITLPQGFKIEVFARVPDARSLVYAPELNGVFVASRRRDAVHLAIDADKDGRADEVKRVIGGLKSPNGLAWRDGRLTIAEQHRIIRLALPDVRAIEQAKPEVMMEGLPDKAHHGWRYAGFDPQGRLHVAVGAPCNICEGEGIEGTIVRIDNAKPVIVAKGVRNSVGFDWHPRTGRMYFTDNGADNMGNDSPPDELNSLEREGQHFGYPFYGGGTDKTREFGARATPEMVPPVARFGAHVAALGVHFYRGRQFPEAYRTDAFVAQHGSWNRSPPDGYRIVRVRMDAEGKVSGTETFAEGWLQGGRAWGRPVDIEELPDGSLLVSDDGSGTIYRISYGK